MNGFWFSMWIASFACSRIILNQALVWFHLNISCTIDNINCFSWSPDSRQLTTSGFSDRTIRVWLNPIGAKALLLDLKQKLTKVKLESHKVRDFSKNSSGHLLKEKSIYLYSVLEHPKVAYHRSPLLSIALYHGRRG